MTRCMAYVVFLVVCFIGITSCAPVEEDDFSVTPEERQLIRRVTRTRAVYPGIGYGGYGLGGFYGGGLGRLGGLGFFDEDQDADSFHEDQDAASDELQDQMMLSPDTLVIPGHMIRKLNVMLHKKAESTDNMESTDNTDLMSATDNSTNQKLRLVRVPHHIFSILSKYAKSTDTDMSNENTDNVSTDLDNTEKGNFEVDGWAAAGKKVRRVPHNIFRKPSHMIRRLKKARLQKHSTDNVDLTSAMDRTTAQKFRLVRVPHSIFSRLSKYATLTGTDMTDMSNENTDSNITDMDNTEEGNFQVDGVAGTTAGLKVLRVPNNIFRKLAKTIPQRLRTAVTDQSLQSLVDGQENSKIRVLNVPHSMYKKLKEQYQTAMDEESDESSE